MYYSRKLVSKSFSLLNRLTDRQVSILSDKIKCTISSESLAQFKLLRQYRYLSTVPVFKIIDNKGEISKTRVIRNKSKQEDLIKPGHYNVDAYTTAEKYDLEELLIGLEQQDLYEPKKFFSTDNLGMEQDVLYVRAKYQVGTEPRDIFFFRDGSVVLWNCNELENNNILNFVKKYERDRYLKPLVTCERETMPYSYLSDESTAKFKNGIFMLSKTEEKFYEKYTFSNAMASSIKLGIWEAILDRYIDNMQFMTDDLKRGRRVRISRADLLRKTGELFALRHSINLSSDLLDTPDFYWDREKLEMLYIQVCSYFSISRRTKVMNDKLNHCVELAELVSSNLNDIHHVRLEWMIIILIMVEVGFEMLHYADRYWATDDYDESDHGTGQKTYKLKPLT